MKNYSLIVFLLINLFIFNAECLEFDGRSFYDNEFQNWRHALYNNNNNNNNNNNHGSFEGLLWPFNRQPTFASRRSDAAEEITPYSSSASVSSERDREPLEIDTISGSFNPDDKNIEIEIHNNDRKTISPTTFNHPTVHPFNRRPVIPKFPSIPVAANSNVNHDLDDDDDEGGIVIGGIGDTATGDDGFLFHQSFNPFFGSVNDHSFFNSFGFGNHGAGFSGFGLDRPQQLQPWWKGPNVCTERKEEVEDFANDEEQLPNFGVHFSLNTCIEKSQKHVCKSIINQNGKKKTSSITHQCCHGFGRIQNENTLAPCEKIELKTIVETSKDLGGDKFINAMKRNDLDEKLLSNLTLFLPNDAAFNEFAEHMLESNLVELPLVRRRRSHSTNDIIGVTTREILLNHMVNGWHNIEDIENEQLLTSEYNNLTIRMNVFPPPPNDNDYEYGYRYTANCVPIKKINQIAESGMIHVLDRVMLPVRNNIMEIIRLRSDMAVLRTVLEKTNLAKELEQSGKHFTMFAPNDKAFEKLNPHLRRTIKEGKACALNILKNHILDMSFCSVAVVDDVKTGAVNSLGIKLALQRSDAKESARLETSEIADLTGIKDIIINDEARILETDIMATNGVLHIIDTVLPTESGMPVSATLEKNNLTTYQKLIEAGGYEDYFDAMENVTFLIPIEKAFENSEWKEKLEKNPSTLRDNKELLQFLEYHIVKPLTKTCDLDDDKLMETLTGETVRMNLYSTHPILPNVMNRATVNCARLMHFDDETCGSVVHQVDKVLMPPKKNLLETLESNENYSMFLQLLRSAKSSNLTSILSNENETLTVLVPKNEIYRELQSLYDDLLNDNERLEKVMQLHIINDALCCSGIVRITWPFVRFVKTISDVDLSLQRDVRPKVQNAGITKCDIMAKNGIIHEINEIVRVNEHRRKQTSALHNFFF